MNSVPDISEKEARCEAIQDALVAMLNKGSSQPSENLAMHLAACDNCRSFLSRTKRARLHFATPEISDAELLRLSLRLGPQTWKMGVRRQMPTRRRQYLGMLAAAFLGGATVFAAQATWNVYTKGSSEPLNDARSPEAASRNPLKGAGSSSMEPNRSITSSEPRAGTISVVPSEHETLNLSSKSVEESVKTSPTPRLSSKKSERSVPEAERLKWADAAESLRNEDTEGAERALQALVLSKDKATRDQASLGVAQLRLSQGRSIEAKEILERLTRESDSVFIRGRATELLQQIPARSRNFSSNSKKD